MSADATTQPTNCTEVCEEHPRVAASGARLHDDAIYRDLAAIFHALGDPTRARIVSSLLHEEVCTCDLAELTGVTESAVSQHLRVLRALRLIKSRRAGKQVFHGLDDAHVALLVHIGLSHLREGDAAHPAMERLLTQVAPPELSA
jgi:ArsR family transcriptional regulator, lead/cadmium/zinc/bismuth-responsive transcriptional repressor